MKISDKGSFELILRTSETGPALLVLKADHVETQLEVSSHEILELVTALGIGPFLSNLVGKYLPS